MGETVRLSYLLAAFVVLGIEVAIALYMHDALIRPYVGDALAVVLVYLGLRGICQISVERAALIAFLVAVAIEFGQYLDILDKLGLAHNQIARIVLGTGFDPMDFVAYAAGALAMLAFETFRVPQGV